MVIYVPFSVSSCVWCLLPCPLSLWMLHCRRRVMGTFTLGEMIMLIAGCACFGVTFAGNIVSRSCEGSGGPPTITFALTYATACHNSLITFLLGLPFERALFWHKGLGYMSLVCDLVPHKHRMQLLSPIECTGYDFNSWIYLSYRQRPRLREW